MAEPPLARNRRQKLLQKAEDDLGPAVQELRALKRRHLALLQAVIRQGPVTVPALCSLLLYEPAGVEEGVQKLKAAGLLEERQEETCRVVTPSVKCGRLRRVIEALE